MIRENREKNRQKETDKNRGRESEMIHLLGARQAISTQKELKIWEK